MDHPSVTRRRPLGQRISLWLATLSYLSAVACAAGAVWYTSDTAGDPVRASLMAATVFFIGCGVVLHVIGKARLQGILSGSGDHDLE